MPPDVVKQLRFHSGGQTQAPTFRTPGRLDPQTLRGVRRLTADPAQVLARLLPPLQPLDLARRRWQQVALHQEIDTSSDQSYWGGAVMQVTINAHARNAAACRACIAHWGSRCVVCGFDFGAVYGPAAQGLIHVHHLRPVCANCHSMLYWRTDKPYAVETVQAWLKAQKADSDGEAA